MSFISAAAIYFIIWWLTLFAVLPFGVRNAHEAGEVIEGGNEPGAPVRHGMRWKAIITTVIASGLFAIIYVMLVTGVLERLDLPFLRDMPRI